MFAQRKLILFESKPMSNHKLFPLQHQFAPQFLCRLQSDRETIDTVENRILQLYRQRRDPSPLVTDGI